MIHLPPAASAMLLVITVLGAWLDIRRVEVPNWLAVASVILGVGLNLFLYGVRGLMVAAAGMILAASTYFVLNLLRIANLGRLKLMAPVGAIIGPWNWLLVCTLSVILGVPIAIVVAFFTAKLHQTGATKGLIVREFFQFLPPYHTADEHRLRRHNGLIMHHGSLFAIGVLFLLSITAVWVSR